MKEKTRVLLQRLFILLFIVGIGSIGFYYARDYIETKRSREVAEKVGTSVDLVIMPSIDPTEEDIKVFSKYANLYEENPDFIGWLKIADTEIDYPVVFTPNNPNKYLYKDFYGNRSNQGTLYLDERTDLAYSDNYIIYGHNNERTTTMFSNLNLYSKEEYWKSHQFIQFDTLNQQYVYEVVGAFLSNTLKAEEEGFRYYRFINAWTEDEFNEYVQFIEKNAIYDTGIDLQYGDQLLTLSTCAYHVKDGRFAVVARRVQTPAQREERVLEKTLKAGNTNA